VDALESSLGRLGKRRPITRTLVVSTIAVVGLAAAVPGAAEDRATCLDQADVRTRTWTEAQARVVASRATRGDGKPIDDRLGRFTQQWQESWSDSCGTVDGESTRSCLAQHADSFDEALALLVREGEAEADRTGTGKGKGDRALQIIAAAGDPTECGPSPVGAVELRDLQLGTALRRARMLHGAGDSRRALDEARTTLDAAIAEGRGRIAAEARFMVGVAQVAVGDVDAGRHNVEEAYYAATASGYGSLARSAAIRMVAVAAHHTFDEEAADFWARQAETAMARPPLASDAERGALGYNLGLLHRSRGRLDRAQEAFAAAAEWFEAADRPAEVLTATAALGSIALDRGDAGRSRILLERAIVQLEPMLGVAHPELAKLLVALGNAQRASGDRDIARLTLQRALDLATRGGTEISRGLAAMNLAVLAFDRGRYAEAASAQRDALDALLRTQPDNHPYVAAARDNLGVMLRMQGALDEACPLHARALDDRRQTGTVRDVLVSTNNLARCRVAQARFEEAEDLLDTAKARAEAELAADDTQLAEIYTSFGMLAQARGRPGEAIVALETARSLWSRHSEPELSRAEGLELLASALAATGGEPESIAALESAARREYAALGHDVAETR
jgi:tetratricopeptide (TPR) repeat protein